MRDHRFSRNSDTRNYSLAYTCSRTGPVTEFHESLRMATKRAGVSNEFMKPMECLCDRKLGELVRFRSFARLACMKEYKLRLVSLCQGQRVFRSRS